MMTPVALSTRAPHKSSDRRCEQLEARRVQLPAHDIVSTARRDQRPDSGLETISRAASRSKLG
jgi:hypothetical protein